MALRISSSQLPHSKVHPSAHLLEVPGFVSGAAECWSWEDLVGAGTPAPALSLSSPPWPAPQVVQLLISDLLLSLRTALWQKQAGASQALGETYHASGAELAGFQRDLGSLRRLAHSFCPAYRKVRSSYLVREGRLGVPRAQHRTNMGSRNWSVEVTQLTWRALVVCCVSFSSALVG